jgi:hypothetical protein
MERVLACRSNFTGKPGWQVGQIVRRRNVERDSIPASVRQKMGRAFPKSDPAKKL